MKEFNLKKYLANNPLLKEDDDFINPGNPASAQAKKDDYDLDAMPPHMRDDENQIKMILDKTDWYEKDIRQALGIIGEFGPVPYEQFTFDEMGFSEEDYFNLLTIVLSDWEKDGKNYQDLKVKFSINEDRFEDVEHIFSGEDDPKLIQWREDRDDLMTQAEVDIDELLMSLKDRAYELGFDTNGPGIWYDIKELIKDKL